MKEVTDPSLLSLLEGGNGKVVIDAGRGEGTLAELKSTAKGRELLKMASSGLTPVTDPEILAALEPKGIGSRLLSATKGTARQALNIVDVPNQLVSMALEGPPLTSDYGQPTVLDRLKDIGKYAIGMGEAPYGDTSAISAVAFGTPVAISGASKIIRKLGKTKLADRVLSVAEEAPPVSKYVATPQPKMSVEQFVKETGGLKPVTDAKVIAELEKPSPTMPQAATLKGGQGKTTPSLESLEARAKGGSTQPLPKYAGQVQREGGSAINLERLDTTNDVKQFINQQVIANEEKIGRHSVSWAETRQTAEDLGWDWKKMVKQRKGKAFTAAEIDAMRQINVNMAEDLFGKIKNLPADRSAITPEMRLDILDSINNYGEVLNSLSSASSEAGRALNIHKRMVANDPAFAEAANRTRISKMLLEKSGLNKLTDEMLTDLQKIDMNDTKAVNAIVQKYHKASIPDMFYEAWMNSILSGPATHATNILSNALTFLTKPTLETPITATIEALKGKGRKAFFGEVPAEVIGAWQGLREGTRAALGAWKTGTPSDIWGKYETPRLNAIPGKTGEIIRIPTRALTAADEFFKSVVYRGELNRQAYATAAKEGLKGEARVKRMGELISSPTLDMLAKAHYEALYRTFNKPLGKIGNQVMGLRDAIPFDAGRFIVPFMRTPANIAKFTLERTPFNLAKIAYDLKLGKLSKEELAPELAKVATGSIIAAALMTFAVEGMVTGGGPKSKNKRDVLYKRGWQPYSIKIGNTYYGYNRLEPLGSIMGMTADFYEMMKDPYREQQNKANVATKIAMSVGKNLTSKTFVQGMSGALDALSDPARYGQNFVERYTGTLIPNVVSQAARATDPYYRETKTTTDYLKSRIPGLSQTVTPKRDIRGNPSEKGGNAITRFISPVAISEIKERR